MFSQQRKNRRSNELDIVSKCLRCDNSTRRKKRRRDELNNMSNVSKCLRGESSSRQVFQPISKSSAASFSNIGPQFQLKDLDKVYTDFMKSQENKGTQDENEYNAAFENFFDEFMKNKDTEARNEHSRIKASSSIAIPITHSYDNAKSDTQISALPVEVMMKIFSLLDDITLFNVSKVSEQWKRIVESKQELWKAYTKKRWPLFQGREGTTNWFKVRLFYCHFLLFYLAILLLLDVFILTIFLLLPHLC